MSAPSVVLAIISWNCREDIESCLQHVEANTRWPDWKLVVVDNTSTDGTREWLRAQPAGRFQLELADSNLGWVGGLNYVLDRFKADYYFFLNPDAFVQPDWLAPLVRAMESDATAGFASPKFRYPDGTIHYAGAFVAKTGGVRVLGHGDPDDPDNRTRDIPFAHGQCLMRATTVREIGALDPGFGIGYYEEVDYQLRARRRGWRSIYVPESVIVHATARAFRKQPNGFKEELMLKNWLRVLSLHWPASSLAWRLPLELLRPLRMVREGSDLRPMFRAWRGWVQSVPELVSRRKELRREGRDVDFTTLGQPGSGAGRPG
jgi:GT2 family glycosyltransferase